MVLWKRQKAHRKVCTNYNFCGGGWCFYVPVCITLQTVTTFKKGNYFSRNMKGREGGLFLLSLIKMNSKAHSLTLYFLSPWIHSCHKYPWYINQSNNKIFLFKLTIATEARKKQMYIFRKWRQLREKRKGFKKTHEYMEK